MIELTWELKKDVNLNIQKILDKLKADWPASEDPNVFYFSGNMSSAKCENSDSQICTYISLHFSKLPDGWEAEEDGSHTIGSDAETLDNYFKNLDETSPEALAYYTMEEYETTLKTIKDAIVSKSWDTMTELERKVLLGVATPDEVMGV